MGYKTKFTKKSIYKQRQKKHFQEHACCKIEMVDKTSLYILCLYRSPSNSSENNKLLNQLILNTSLIGRKLQTLGDLNWDNLPTPHLSSHFASVLLAATQDIFLLQYVQSPTHTGILDLIKSGL